MIPDSCILLDYMLALTTDVVDRLLVYPENMLKNLHRTHGLIFSQSVLLALTKKGMKREDAYRIVQTVARWMCGRTGRNSRICCSPNRPCVMCSGWTGSKHCSI